MGAIDRRKHDIDVMERILSGVREEADAFDPPTDMVNIRVRPWFAGASTSVVHVTVSHPQPSPDRPHRKTDQEESDPYESDRRGEHR